MDSPEIEYLISEAINNRPRGTNAPLNLYVHKNRLICGSRIAMPSHAVFVAHITDDRLRNGFNTREWKSIIEKTREVTETVKLQGATINNPRDFEHINPADIYQRRAEQRLYYRRPILYTADTNQLPLKAVMFDISSGGISFTCCIDENSLLQGQDISTNFSVPCFNSDDSLAIVDFDRIGRIHRINKKDNTLHQIAVQFANPLPFKPGEQGIKQFAAKHTFDTSLI